jgi:hypothetical protein
MKKTLDLSELSRLIAEGPAGREKIERQAKAISELQEALMLMVKRTRPYEIPVRSEANTIRFGIGGDTHIGSLYQRVDALKLFYERCAAEGIEQVLSVGDVVDGWHVYRGHEFELHPNGRSWPEQRDMFAEVVPRIKGLTTAFITGNHDASYKKQIGMIVGDELQRIRPDWKFIGADVGEVVLKADSGLKFKILLVHPGDRGNAYAVSYRLQKFIEAIPGGQKPNMIVLGHYHKALFMPDYRNVAGMLAGCFQSQTPYMAAQASAAQVGGWIVTVTLNERRKLTSRVQAEFVSFYEEQR